MANNTVKVRVDLNEPRILQKVLNERFGVFVANEWKRLVDPYTPRDTGTMQDTAKVSPWTITYDAMSADGTKSYAAYVYYGKDYNFKKNNPYSTYEWDKAAANAGQTDKLERTINAAIGSGQF